MTGQRHPGAPWAAALGDRLHERAPRIHVHERTLANGRQHVSLALDLPLVGRAYEYAGAFDYRIETGAGGAA